MEQKSGVWGKDTQHQPRVWDYPSHLASPALENLSGVQVKPVRVVHTWAGVLSARVN